MLEGKKILIGISGSIAAYKCAALTRLFVKAGAEVKIVMTPSALEFITPLTLATLSKNPVHTQFVKNKEGEWTNHVELGLWADLFLIAPATANTLAKMAHGICDNLLMSVYLSARCEVWVAPAMDLDMFQHAATQQNLQTLKQYGHTIIDPDHGELASGLEGKGRMAEPENILARIELHFKNGQKLKGKKILVTAGPTYEHIDPVRFLGNHSSGKMGFALAKALAQAGAEVTLISGPTSQSIQHSHIKRIDVVSAEEMYTQSIKYFKQAHIAVMSAAVADYTPTEVSTEKIKKKGDELVLTLRKTKDVLKELGTLKKKNQLLVGFALETNDEEKNALKKLKEKNLDFIVLNSLNTAGAGFGHDTNQIRILDANGKKTDYSLKSKQQVAADIVAYIIEKLHA